MNLKMFEPHLHLKASITYTSSAPLTWWSWSEGADPDDESQSALLCPEDQLHTYKQLQDSMDISSGLPRPLWPGMLHLSQAFSDTPACLGKQAKGKGSFTHLLPQEVKLQEPLSNLILVIVPGSKVQEETSITI